MTAKEYLRRGIRLTEHINSYVEEIKSLRLLASEISAPSFEEHYGSTRSTEAPFTRHVVKLIDMENQLDQKIAELVTLKTEINAAIDSVKDPDERLLLRMRYVNNCSWEEISSALNLCLRTVHRLHATALQKFSVPEQSCHTLS